MAGAERVTWTDFDAWERRTERDLTAAEARAVLLLTDVLGYPEKEG